MIGAVIAGGAFTQATASVADEPYADERIEPLPLSHVSLKPQLVVDDVHDPSDRSF